MSLVRREVHRERKLTQGRGDGGDRLFVAAYLLRV